MECQIQYEKQSKYLTASSSVCWKDFPMKLDSAKMFSSNFLFHHTSIFILIYHDVSNLSWQLWRHIFRRKWNIYVITNTRFINSVTSPLKILNFLASYLNSIFFHLTISSREYPRRILSYLVPEDISIFYRCTRLFVLRKCHGEICQRNIL